MAAQRIRALPLYPEDRDCKAPSTDRVLEVFGPLQRHLLCQEGLVRPRFDPKLSRLQRTLLSFIGVSQKAFLNT